MIRWQVFIFIDKMILPELFCGVAEGFQFLRNLNVPFHQSNRSAWYPDLAETRANRRLAGDERRATRGTAVFRIVIGERESLFADTVDVRCVIAHQSMRITADIRLADVIAEDNKDIWLVCRCR